MPDEPKSQDGKVPSDTGRLEEPAAAYSVAGANQSHAPGLEDEDPSWAEFRDQCRRQMQRPMENRLKYGFCRMYKPVLDDAPWRAFDTMAEYRAWCAANLPRYLGFQVPEP